RGDEDEWIVEAQFATLQARTPMNVLTFRDHLMPASGFQSAQFREIEFVSGLKDPKFVEYYEPGTPARTRLDRRLEGRTLREAFHGVLERAGFTADAAGIASLYRKSPSNMELFLLAEALIDFDELMTQWRTR